jgi:hypothetical protein
MILRDGRGSSSSFQVDLSFMLDMLVLVVLASTWVVFDCLISGE